MRKICISKDWYFLGSSQPQAGGAGYSGTAAAPELRPIDLPHDYAVEQQRSPDALGKGSVGYFNGGPGKYVKYVTLNADEHSILDIDGAYMDAEIWFNENQIAMHPYGYTPFLVDLTGRVLPGVPNKLVITTDDHQPSSRWYSGAGIYRDVFLWTGGKVRIEPWDLFVTTPQADKSEAQVDVSCTLSSDIDAEAQLTVTVKDDEGCVVATDNWSAAVLANDKVDTKRVLTVKKPKLWDVDSPSLYTLDVTITVDGEQTDSFEQTFGIRTISYTVENGFQLNGKTMKMRGGCIHHDHGVLGAAAFPAAEARKVRLLKQAGFNALRISHNPPSLALLEACDRQGMIVMDEAFDMWNVRKKANDYHLYFADWCDRDISYMVLRDRNHPCVMSYSVGNELNERDGSSNCAYWSGRLAEQVRKYDTTRPVTSCICVNNSYRPDSTDPEDYLAASHHIRAAALGGGSLKDRWDEYAEEYMATLDIVGYNYLYMRYAHDHEKYPNRVIWGSETQALKFPKSWKAVMDCDFVVGDFTWTAIDNMGEVGGGRLLWDNDGKITDGITIQGYPWRTCWQGDLDLCGYRRPQSYFREAIWLGMRETKIYTTHPKHHGEGFTGTGWHFHDVHETWTFEDEYLGKPVKTDVYTDGDEVVYYLNGTEVGRAQPVEYIASLDIPYARGEVSVVVMKDGEEYGRAALQTTGAISAIVVEPEAQSVTADRRDLAYFRISITDSEGRVITEAKNALNCTVEGGELMGIFSGDFANDDRYTSNECHAFEGRALAIVRTAQPGTVKVTVSGEGLTDGTATVEAV